MGSMYVLTTLVTSMLLILIGCGASKNSKTDAPLVQSDQPKTSNEAGNQAEDNTEDDSKDDAAPIGTQPPAKKPPVTANPRPPHPPVNTPKFGQAVAAEQESIQTKLLDVYCVACHSGAAPKANLNLESLTPYLTGELGANGYRGVLLFPGRGDISTLKLVMARHEAYPAMPPSENTLKIPAVTDQQISAVSTWIDGLKASEDEGSGIGRN